MFWRVTKFLLMIRDDSRESYLYWGDQPLALVMEGDQYDPLMGLLGVYDAPNHERLVHDGTPHRNPAVYERWRIGTIFWVIPFPVRYQQSWYSLHISEDYRQADIHLLQEAIHNIRWPRRHRAYIAPMNASVQRAIEKVESQGQRANGVPFWNLRPSRSRRRPEEL